MRRAVSLTPIPVLGLLALSPVTSARADDREAVRVTIRQHRPRLHACYEVARAKRPDFQDRVVVTFEVGPAGRVLAARVTQRETEAPAFEACLLDEVRGWELRRGPGAGRILVAHPFVFRPPAGGARPHRESAPGLDPRLDSEAARATLDAGRAQLAACYAEGAKRDPTLAGRGTVVFTIGGDGQVTEARITGLDLPDDAVRGCVSTAVRGWRFPAPKGGEPVVVRYPFVLAPR